MSIADNLKRVGDSIADACAKHGRSPKEITLVAVSKTYPLDSVLLAHQAGQVDFGENRVQEYTEKQPGLPAANWHLIGHLQTNKVKYIADTVHLLHSLDSIKLAKALQKRATKPVDCLIQLNISEEDQKSGLNSAGLKELLAALPDYPNVRVKGLMGIAENTDSNSIIRHQFSNLRKQFDTIARNEQVQMQHLSMGMSGDFPLAIAEGATMLRIGSAIFGARNYSG